MNVLVFNCGSSSLKYRLIAIRTSGSCPAAKRSGLVPRRPSRRAWCCNAMRVKRKRAVPMRNHAQALQEVVRELQATPGAMPDVIGHRLVNGGPSITEHSRVDNDVFAELRRHQDLAPIHNPPAIDTIEACRVIPGSAAGCHFRYPFHRTIPEHARTYAIPRELSASLGIRKYGFHGISHQYVTTEVARLMGIPLSEFCAVSCHLGSGGASLCGGQRPVGRQHDGRFAAAGVGDEQRAAVISIRESHYVCSPKPEGTGVPSKDS